MDRFYRGFIAGVAGGVIMNIWSLASVHLLHFSQFRVLDWVAVMTFGSPAHTTMEAMVSFITHLAWTGFLGIITAYLLTLVTSRKYLIKGAIIGTILFFILNALPVLFQTPYLRDITFGTAVSNAIGGILWGLATALTLRFFETTPGNSTAELERKKTPVLLLDNKYRSKNRPYTV